MQKIKNQTALDPKEKALEIIELEISDLQTLARAFNVIAEVCGSEEHIPTPESEVHVH